MAKTSFDNVWIRRPYAHWWSIGVAKRPVCDPLYYFDDFERNEMITGMYNYCDQSETVWDYETREVRKTLRDGTQMVWYERPSIQDIWDGKEGHGKYVKYNKDGSVFIEGEWCTPWFFGPEKEDAEAYMEFSHDDLDEGRDYAIVERDGQTIKMYHVNKWVLGFCKWCCMEEKWCFCDRYDADEVEFRRRESFRHDY